MIPKPKHNTVTKRKVAPGFRGLVRCIVTLGIATTSFPTQKGASSCPLAMMLFLLLIFNPKTRLPKREVQYSHDAQNCRLVEHSSLSVQSTTNHPCHFLYSPPTIMPS